MMYKDKYVHAVVVCEEMALLREDFYAHVRHTFGNQVYNELRSGSDERKLQTLIGKRILALLNLNVQKHFLRMAISYVSTCMLSVKLDVMLLIALYTYCDVLFCFCVPNVKLCMYCSCFFPFKITRVGHCYNQLLLVYRAF